MHFLFLIHCILKAESIVNYPDEKNVNYKINLKNSNYIIKFNLKRMFIILKDTVIAATSSYNMDSLINMIDSCF